MEHVIQLKNPGRKIEYLSLTVVKIRGREHCSAIKNEHGAVDGVGCAYAVCDMHNYGFRAGLPVRRRYAYVGNSGRC